MGQIILLIIGLLVAILGVIMIFDARLLTQKFFSFGDQNEATAGFKILGFGVAVIGGLIVLFSR
jgi:hypothetical protein